MYFRLSFCDSFTREARSDLAQSVKVDGLERVLIKAFSQRFPRFTAMHQRTKVPISVDS